MKDEPAEDRNRQDSNGRENPKGERRHSTARAKEADGRWQIEEAERGSRGQIEAPETVTGIRQFKDAGSEEAVRKAIRYPLEIRSRLAKGRFHQQKGRQFALTNSRI